jgi:hypothetical protein
MYTANPQQFCSSRIQCRTVCDEEMYRTSCTRRRTRLPQCMAIWRQSLDAADVFFFDGVASAETGEGPKHLFYQSSTGHDQKATFSDIRRGARRGGWWSGRNGGRLFMVSIQRTGGMLTRRRNSVLPARYGAFLVGALVVLSSVATNAETRLTGQVDAIRMEARDASIEDVLTALGATYGLRFRTETSLGAHITGTFTGPLVKVVAQVLNGYDYVSKSTNGAVEVAVVGVVGDRQAVPSPATLPAFETLPPPATAPSTRAVPAVPLAFFDWEMPKNVDHPR